MSPSIEYTPSTTMSFGALRGVSQSFFSRSLMSLWRNLRTSLKLRRLPSMMQAWSRASRKM